MRDPKEAKEIRTLVIEDNPTNLELMTYILSAFGHNVVTAMTGEGGMEAALDSLPSVIICDVQLPDVNGYEVARRLKSDPVLRHIPLIAVTALAMVGDRERLLAAGFDGYIPKPISPELFVRQVEEYLPAQERLGLVLEDVAPAAEPHESPSAAPRGSILIINHSPSNIELAKKILEPSGFTVTAEEDHEPMLSDAEHPLPDLVLYDVHGFMDRGRAFVERALDNERLRLTPLILISSSLWRERERNGNETIGPVKYLVRPLDPEVLMSAISDCLGGERASKGRP